MKKAITISFLAVYLLATTEAFQLLKLPFIFQHFKEHKLAEGNITFFQFLDIHYMHGSPKDDDYARDMKLPFKTSGESIALFNFGFVQPGLQFLVIRPVTISKRFNLVIQDNFISSPYLSNIWQPPKSC